MYPPLRQAEWIKFIGLLIGEEEKANVIFDSIKAEYNTLKQLTAKIEKKPVVFSGELRGGNWYAVGGRNFLAQLFRDAGADYFLKDNINTHPVYGKRQLKNFATSMFRKLHFLD